MILPKERLVCDGERHFKWDYGWLEIPVFWVKEIICFSPWFSFRGMTELFEKLDVDKSGSLKSHPGPVG